MSSHLHPLYRFDPGCYQYGTKEIVLKYKIINWHLWIVNRITVGSLERLSDYPVTGGYLVDAHIAPSWGGSIQMYGQIGIHSACKKASDCTLWWPIISMATLHCGLATTHTHLTALCRGLPRWAGTRKVKPIWIYWSKWQWVAVASSGPYASLHCTPYR